MKKEIYYSFVIILVLGTNQTFSQENNNENWHHNTFLEFAGMTYLGGSLNYEYSILISNSFRLNPGLGIGYEYTVTDTRSYYHFNFYPNLKVLYGKTRHFIEAGIYANFGYDMPIGGIIGYRYYPKKSPLFLRVSVNRIEHATVTPVWAGFSIGLRF